MLSNKPYLIRAFYDWIQDSNCTPFVVIQADGPQIQVPLEHVENDQITLNISSEAVRDLKIANELIYFRASFSGVVHIISAPIKAVVAIYAQENGQGMFFDTDENEPSDLLWEVPPTPTTVSNNKEISKNSDSDSHNSVKRVPHLKLVETNKN